LRPHGPDDRSDTQILEALADLEHPERTAMPTVPYPVILHRTFLVLSGRFGLRCDAEAA